MPFLSRDSRRRHKEAFLQKIGAHSSSSEDTKFVEQAKAHSDIAERVEDAQRALSEYRACLEATSRAGEYLASCLDALVESTAGSEDVELRPLSELLAQRHRRLAKVVAPATCHVLKELAEGPLTRASSDGLERVADLTAKRRQARLDSDSFHSSRQDDRADEARRKLEALTRGCEAEFYSFKSRVRNVSGQVLGSVHGSQCAFFERCAEAFADRLVAQDRYTNPAFNSFAAAALALCSMNEAELEASSPSVQFTAPTDVALQHLSPLAASDLSAPASTPSDSLSNPPRFTTTAGKPPLASSRPPQRVVETPALLPATGRSANHLMPTGGAALPSAPPRQSRPRPPAPPPQQQRPPPPPPREVVVAKHPFAGSRPGDLSFEAGDVIFVTMKKSGGWWQGHVAGSSPETAGAFPKNYVGPRDGREAAPL